MPSLVTFLPVVSEKKSFEEIVDDARTDGRTDALTHDDGRRTEDNPNSSPWHFVPGELKIMFQRREKAGLWSKGIIILIHCPPKVPSHFSFQALPLSKALFMGIKRSVSVLIVGCINPDNIPF